MGLFTTDKHTQRCYTWIYFIRIAGILISIAALGASASLLSAMKDISCNTPPKIAYNVAAGVLSFLLLFYFIFAAGPTPVLRSIPFSIWLSLGLDAFLFIIWIAAAATSNVTCNELCSACSNLLPDFVALDNRVCTCTYYVDKRNMSPARKSPLTLDKRYSRYSSGGGSGSGIDARIAFDAIMCILFAICIGGTILWLLKERKRQPTHAEHGPPTTTYESSHPMQSAPMQPMKPGESSQPQMYPQQQPQQPVYPNQNTTENGYAQPQNPVVHQQSPPQYTSSVPPQAQQQQQHHGAADDYYSGQRGVQGGRQDPRSAVSEMQSPGPSEVSEMHSPPPTQTWERPVGNM
ncbi:MAG: hypothetical protein OHK93_002125 [Ramalina farinacea]|uniref:MARVEL domain-containing protein n=1 Tax=Ramalina farinacea TaxID=258253 RepID=A0AA43TYE3_9LECA|nr:hypothetical protein [Ramalina farinacea]